MSNGQSGLNTLSDASYFELGVLISSINWFFIRSTASLMSGGFFQIHGHVLEKCPIPAASETQRTEIATLAESCQHAAEARRDCQASFRHRDVPGFAIGPDAYVGPSKFPPPWGSSDPCAQTVVNMHDAHGLGRRIRNVLIGDDEETRHRHGMVVHQTQRLAAERARPYQPRLRGHRLRSPEKQLRGSGSCVSGCCGGWPATRE